MTISFKAMACLCGFLTNEEAAAYLCVSPRTIARWAQEQHDYSNQDACDAILKLVGLYDQMQSVYETALEKFRHANLPEQEFYPEMSRLFAHRWINLPSPTQNAIRLMLVLNADPLWSNSRPFSVMAESARGKDAPKN